MIPIERHEDEVPLAWDGSRAAQLQREANALATHEELSKFLGRMPYWTKLIALFTHWSYGKCWYTEAKTREHGGAFEIDHFRPKLGARDPWNERPDWKGYPWLAYEWKNFRLSAASANRLGDDVHGNASGKGVQFPLRSADSPIATCHADLAQECAHVLLIDPCESDQVSDLSFAEDGMVTCTCSNDAFRKARVERTVNVYNLDHPGLCARRREIWQSCQSIVSRIAKLERMITLTSSGPLDSMITELREELSLKFRSDQEFAGTARAFARTRGEEWVRVASQNVKSPPYESFASVSSRLVANDDNDEEHFHPSGPSNIDERDARPDSSSHGHQFAFSFMSELTASTSARPSASAKRRASAKVRPAVSRQRPRKSSSK